MIQRSSVRAIYAALLILSRDKYGPDFAFLVFKQDEHWEHVQYAETKKEHLSNGLSRLVYVVDIAVVYGDTTSAISDFFLFGCITDNELKLRGILASTCMGSRLSGVDATGMPRFLETFSIVLR